MLEHDTITTPVFLPADGKASWLLLPNLLIISRGYSAEYELAVQTSQIVKIF